MEFHVGFGSSKDNKHIIFDLNLSLELMTGQNHVKPICQGLLI